MLLSLSYVLWPYLSREVLCTLHRITRCAAEAYARRLGICPASLPSETACSTPRAPDFVRFDFWDYEAPHLEPYSRLWCTPALALAGGQTKVTEKMLLG